MSIHHVALSSPAAATFRTGQVAVGYGVPIEGGPITVIERMAVPIGPGRIVLVLGPSGAGKSSALGAVERSIPGGVFVQRVAFPLTAAIVDAVAPAAELGEALSLLSRCALGEAPLWLRRFDELSDGQKFRARLARAIGLHIRGGSGGGGSDEGGGAAAAPLICDEFCTGLHRRAARAVAFNLRKLVTRHRLAVVVASCHEDVIGDLQPDVVVRLAGDDGGRVERRAVRRRPISFRRRLVIEPGGKRDYHAFAAMHYKGGGELGFVDKVFVLREGAGGEPLGIVVYAHGPIELALRNRATSGRFLRQPHRLNRELRILRRLVVHPDVRGCGLGHFLVRRTLPRVGTRFVECLAAMGEVNPVFEKAGMTRVGRCEPSDERRRAIDILMSLGVDPLARDFPVHVSRRRDVRAVVAGVVFRWYQATSGEGVGRVARQSPVTLAHTFRGLIGMRPVYYLWESPGK